MSKPASRLSAFRSYSYYHVLVMCDSTDTADRLAQSTQPDVWHHATDETRAADNRPNAANLGKYSPKCVLDENGQCVGRYIVLIDGASDAAFSINQVKITSATAANAVPDDSSTSLAVEGSLMISEPKGVAFLDQVVKCSIALGVDNSQIVYALKTFFVGYRYDEEYGDIPDSINDIPPVNFITYDVTGSFTEQGGTYEMLFVAIANGAARLPQYSKAVSSMNFTSGSSLKDTFTKLEDVIRSNYKRYYDCIIAQLESVGTPEATALKDSLCEVTYTIKVEDPYTEPSYVVTDGPMQYKDEATCSGPVKWSFPPNSSIETAIATIMGRCDKVQKDMADGDPATGVKYEYKIHSCVKSTRVSGADAQTGKLQYEVMYTINQIVTPKTIANESGFAKFAQDEDQLRKDPLYDKLRKNVIEFDYIYTGNNIDILEFDIKVNMGLAYLQTATLANTFKGQLEGVPVLAQGTSRQSYETHKDGRFIPGPPLQTPVFFGKQIAHPKVINKKDANNAIQSAYTLAKHASLEVAEASMRIAGNDRLLATTSRATSAAAMEAGPPEDDDTPEEAREADFKYWNYVPAYAKVNIKMPRDNDDFALFTGQASDDGTPLTSSADYARDFWFDGYYYVVGIEHVFDNGEFTQTLDMISIPKTSAFGSTKGSKEESFDIKLDKCYDSTTGCGKTPAQQPAGTTHTSAAAVPAQPQTAELNMNDAKSVQKSPTSLDRIKGWSAPYQKVQASKEVKDAIQAAGSKYGVDPVTLAQFCYQESKFDPSARPPKGGAVGLFQFVPGSWDIRTIGGKYDDVITKDVLSNPSNRYDPHLNAHAAAKYLTTNASRINSNAVGDLYLAHFLGSGSAKTRNGAWAIIDADNRTNGTATVAETLGFAKTNELMKYNPGVITSTTTVRDLRTWAHRKMAEAFIDPYKVVQPSYTQQTIQSATRNQAAEPVERAKSTVQAKDKVSAQQDCKVKDEKPPEDKETCNKTSDKVETASDISEQSSFGTSA